MSFIPFTAGESTIPFLAAPNAAGEKLIVVSSLAADTGVGTTLRGLVGAAADSETVTLSGTLGGRIEREGTKAFKTLTGASVASATGSISIRGQGTAGVGDVRVDSVPASGTTWEIGLVGFTQSYTFRDPCRATIQLPATGASFVTGASAASYVKITLNGTAKYFWFSNGTTTDPAPGGTGYAVAFTGADADTVMAAALRASMVTNLTNFITSVATHTVTITGLALGAITIVQDAGADMTLTTVDAGTADAANQIRTGYDTDGTAATTTDVALWIQYAVNVAVGTAGTHYGTGTASNAYLSASASTDLVTLTDRIACLRTLGWTRTDGTGLTTRTPLGGVNGALMVALTGTESSGTAQDFDNADLADDNLLALFASPTDGIFLNGRPATLRLKCENISSAVAITAQSSDDGITYENISGVSITDLDNNSQYIELPQREYVRLNITSNANTSNVSVHMGVIL